MTRALLSLIVGAVIASALALALEYETCLDRLDSTVYPVRWSVVYGCQVSPTHGMWVPIGSVRLFR